MAAFAETPAPRNVLNSHGRSYYRRHFRRLVLDGILKPADFDNWIELCRYFGEVQDLRKAIKVEGEIVEDRNGTKRRNPKLIRLRDTESKYMRLSSRFGLDPAGRRRIKIVPPDEAKEFDVFVKYSCWLTETFEERLTGRVAVPAEFQGYFFSPAEAVLESIEADTAEFLSSQAARAEGGETIRGVNRRMAEVTEADLAALWDNE